MEGFQFISCIRFSLQLIFCESMFVVYFPRRKYFILRVLLALTMYFALSYGVVALFRLTPGSVRNLMRSIYYCVIFGLTMGLMLVCFKISLKEALFAGTGGYTLQHLTYSLNSIVRYIVSVIFPGALSGLSGFWNYVLFRSLPYVAVGLIFFFAVVRRKQKKGELKDRDGRMLCIANIALLINIFISVFRGEGMGAPVNRFTNSVICGSYSIVSCTLILFLQYNVFLWNKSDHEKEVMKQLLEMERQQHEVAKKNIDIINIKCHDLKHQIVALKRIDNTQERSQVIDEIEKTVDIYDSFVKSGNDAFDLILSEKSLLCKKYKIKFSAILDGKQLRFMSNADIYALFGNALDNAIESVIKESEEKRLISMCVKSENGMPFIHIENYYSGNLQIEDDLPLTTKAEKEYHGFGVKSIRYIAEKYGGSVFIRAKNNKFCLDILFGNID